MDAAGLRVEYHKYLRQLAGVVEALSDDQLWATVGAIDNSVGVLVKHVTGNLNHFIGAGLGGQLYQRDRTAEFASAASERAVLVAAFEQVTDLVTGYLASVTSDELNRSVNLAGAQECQTVGHVLVKLLGHLAYHVGEARYLQLLVCPPLGSERS